MADADRHPIEAIHALVDGRLDAAERNAVERHLEQCAACRAERTGAEATKRIVRDALPGAPPPPGLETRIRAALDEVDRGALAGARRPRLAWLVPAAVVVVAGVLAAVLLLSGPREAGPVGPRIVAEVADDYDGVRAGAIPLERTEASPAELERWFAEHGIDFRTRVFDLGMMGWSVAGGRVAPLAGRSSAMFAYRGADGLLMLCRMYLGTLTELPEPARVVERDGRPFRVYRRGALTLVFWAEGDGVVCVLASEAPEQTVIDLAVAKALEARAGPRPFLAGGHRPT